MNLTPVLSSRFRWLLRAESLLAAGRLRPAGGDEAAQAIETAPGPNPEPPVDLAALRRLDPEAITRVHNRFFPDVYRYARYRLNDDALAEDVAGETFTRLLETVHRGQGPRDNVRGWLMRTAANLVNDYYRAMYARPVEELDETHASDHPGPAVQYETAAEKRALMDALKKLTEEQANVLALRFGSGLSLEDTARALGKNANAIKALQFRAVAALRKELTAAFGLNAD